VHTRVQEGNSEDTALSVHVAGAEHQFLTTTAGFILNTLTIRVIVTPLSAAQGRHAPRYIDGAEASLRRIALSARGHDHSADSRPQPK